MKGKENMFDSNLVVSLGNTNMVGYRPSEFINSSNTYSHRTILRYVRRSKAEPGKCSKKVGIICGS